MKEYKVALGATLVAASIILPASAAITVVGTASWQNGGSGNIAGTFDASGSDKLVLVVTGEHGFNQTGNGKIGDVFYDGVQMTPAVTRSPIKANVDSGILVDDTWNAIFFLDNPATSTGSITMTGFASRGSVAVLALSGTNPGVGNTAIGPRDTNSADLTTSAQSIVVASYGMGGTGNTAQLNTITNPLPGFTAEIVRQENGNNWDGHVVAYANEVAAGTATYTFDDTTTPLSDGRTGRHVILAEFTAVPAQSSAIPETTSLSVIGLIGMALLRRRR